MDDTIFEIGESLMSTGSLKRLVSVTKCLIYKHSGLLGSNLLNSNLLVCMCLLVTREFNDENRLHKIQAKHPALPPPKQI